MGECDPRPSANQKRHMTLRSLISESPATRHPQPRLNLRNDEATQKAGEHPNCSPAFLQVKSDTPLKRLDVARPKKMEHFVRQALPFGIGMLALAGCIPIGNGGEQHSERHIPAKNAPPSFSVPPSSPALSPPSVPAPSNSCIDQLWDTRANFILISDKVDREGCSLRNAVRLESFGGDRGAIKVTNLSAVSCDVAHAMSGWVRYGVDRAAREILGSGVARIETFGAYNCRMIAGTRRLSAHAAGKAIDVSGFILDDGRQVSLKHSWHGGSAAERRFLRAIRQSACRRFNTVLSPDYDAAHVDHFHLEVGRGSLCK